MSVRELEMIRTTYAGTGFSSATVLARMVMVAPVRRAPSTVWNCRDVSFPSSPICD